MRVARRSHVTKVTYVEFIIKSIKLRNSQKQGLGLELGTSMGLSKCKCQGKDKDIQRERHHASLLLAIRLWKRWTSRNWNFLSGPMLEGKGWCIGTSHRGTLSRRNRCHWDSEMAQEVGKGPGQKSL